MRKTEKWRMNSAVADEMPAEGAEEGHLRRLLTNTINTIEDNKTQIFDIYENMRTEVEETRRRLAELKERVGETIDRVDGLAEDERRARLRLAEVSEKFTEYTEDEIRKTYEAVSIIQINLAIEREKEQSLRVERDKLEIRLRYLLKVVARAEHMALSIGSVVSYLSTQVSGVLWKIEAVQKDKFVGARIIKATEEERYRISREIHDGPAQRDSQMSDERPPDHLRYAADGTRRSRPPAGSGAADRPLWRARQTARDIQPGGRLLCPAKTCGDRRVPHRTGGAQQRCPACADG